MLKMKHAANVYEESLHLQALRERSLLIQPRPHWSHHSRSTLDEPTPTDEPALERLGEAEALLLSCSESWWIETRWRPRSCLREKERPHPVWWQTWGLVRFGSWVAMCVLRLNCLAKERGHWGQGYLRRGSLCPGDSLPEPAWSYAWSTGTYGCAWARAWMCWDGTSRWTRPEWVRRP